MATYWGCFQTNMNISYGDDPSLYLKIHDETGAVRIDDFSTRNSMLEIDLVASAETEQEAREAMWGWLDGYLRQAEWIREIGAYDPDAVADADFHEPADVFNEAGFEVR